MSSHQALLSIHYYYPPIHSIGVIRNYHITHALQNHVENKLVLTTSNRNTLPKSNLITIDESIIKELATNDYRTKLSTKNNIHYTEKSKSSSIAKFAVKLINSYPFNTWIGEGGSKYINEGVNKGIEFLNKNPEAIIYCSFRPYADLIIGSKLKAQYPRTKLIVDFRDLHVDPMYNNVFLKSFQIKTTKRIIKDASMITTVSNGLATQLGKYQKPIKTIYNGVKIRPIKSSDNNKFNISYTGSMFGEFRNPSFLFKIISEKLANSKFDKNKIQINYAGKDEQTFLSYIKKHNLEHVYKNLGMISHQDALNLQSSSQINVLLTGALKNYTGILTGKLFEYLGSRKPIAAIVLGERDSELEDILNKTDAGMCLYSTNEKDSSNWVQDIYDKWLENKESLSNVDQLTKLFSWKESANKIINAL